MGIEQIITALKEERERLDRAIAALTGSSRSIADRSTGGLGFERSHQTAIESESARQDRGGSAETMGRAKDEKKKVIEKHLLSGAW